MNSVLIAKIEASTYSSAGIIKGLRDNFSEVHEFNYQNVMFNEGVEGMRKRLMGKLMMCNPDVCILHIQNPEPLDINTIQFLSERTFVVMYTFDVRQDIEWYKEYAPYVGLIVFGDGESIESCKKSGIDNVAYLHSSADFDLYRPLPEGINPDKNYGEIVFIGNNYVGTNLKYPLAKQRTEMVEVMKDNFGDRFQVYGIGWPGSRMINQIEEIAAYHSCKIAITHNNFLRHGYTSDRLWRSIGCGACTLGQYYVGYLDDFPSAAWEHWESLDHLVYQCNVILMNDEQRIETAKLQHDHVIKNHTWTHRFNKLKKLILNHGYAKRMENVSTSGTGSSK